MDCDTLNVPGHGESQTKQLRRKMKWVLVAILAPEVGVFTAWQHLWLAMQFNLEINRLRDNHEAENGVKSTQRSFMSQIT